MSILALVADQISIARILEHLGLRLPEQDKPPPPRDIPNRRPQLQDAVHHRAYEFRFFPKNGYTRLATSPAGHGSALGRILVAGSP